MDRRVQLAQRSLLSPYPTTRVVDVHVFREGETCEVNDRRFWETFIPFHGPLQGEVRATPFRHMYGDPGDRDVVIVPSLSLW